MNPWIILRNLLPGESITEGVVDSIAQDGTILVTTVNGGTMRCSSAITVQEGQTVSITGQRITEVIEDLQTFTITI